MRIEPYCTITPSHHLLRSTCERSHVLWCDCFGGSGHPSIHISALAHHFKSYPEGNLTGDTNQLLASQYDGRLSSAVYMVRPED